ncbi:pilus assembly protein [Xenophilus arseniciresistens]|uniref:Pilus assembly protein n=1 Tax=Xenophilus arseniciresistens TaxID=1283306 RepID=A0AAE3NBI4_9BURK|nr:TadE/TadG family type IV pilus assembly protein [Xenophilus arseniciresistens]MDA7418168.1 pilus assembly protein [Xenophilus arseniciresistens]
MTTRPIRMPARRHRQRGVYAVEYALVFLLFFGLIYALICYSLLFTYRLALQHAAEDGARAALRVRVPDVGDQMNYRKRAAESMVLRRVGTWLPVAPGIRTCVQRVADPDDCSSVEPSIAECQPQGGWPGTCRILVRVQAAGLSQVLPPFPGFALPQAVTGQASVLLDGRTLL